MLVKSFNILAWNEHLKNTNISNDICLKIDYGKITINSKNTDSQIELNNSNNNYSEYDEESKLRSEMSKEYN